MICFICGVSLRYPMFPLNLMFWKRKAAIYEFTTDIEEDTYAVKTILCDKDHDWVVDNQTVGEALLTSKITAMERNKTED